MAAAYAALVSLLNTMDQIQIHPLLSTAFNKYPIEPLRGKIDLFLDFVENYSDAEDLVRRIAVVAHEAEDTIEVHAAASTRKGLRISRKLKKVVTHRTRVVVISQTFLPSLQRIIDDMDSIKEQIMIKAETGNRQHKSSLPPPSSSDHATPMVDNYSEEEDLARRMAVVALEDNEIIQVQLADPICDQHSPSLLPDMHSTKEDKDSIKKKDIKAKETTSSPSSAKTTNMVGFERYMEQLLDQLTGQPSSRKILPIVGMGGIGKTTLARNVYDNLLTMEHFYVRAWINVSQEFSVGEILLQALSCLEESTSETDRTYSQLGQELHKILYGWKYLIVLDDIWSVEVWDKIKCFFPKTNNGSRIIITTRQSELVGYFGSSALAVDFLDDKNSWKLFCEKTFPQQDCPPKLVEIGKKIVAKCKGLPLSIVVVGGFLRNSPRTLEYWKEIAKHTSLILDSGEGNTPWSILYLSYKQLPVWLKSCFLYLGLFPEDHKIKVSQLIKLWVAEGFIKSNKDQSLEEVAENYVKELVDRNLVLVGELRLNKKIKTCLVQDLVRDLCLRIAENEKAFCVQRDIDGKRRFIVNERMERDYHTESHSPSLVHPLILVRYQTLQQSNSRLLRVLFSDGKTLDPFREVNLRLLIHTSYYDLYEISPSVSLLWSLQTLIVTGCSVTAPCEIWKMPQLRHINIKESVFLPHPPPSNDVLVLQNLQTLARVEDLVVTEEVCKRIPNIKKLGIIYNAEARGEKASSSSYHLHNVGCFSKLETLQCYGNGYKYVGDLFRNLKFPSSLKKLTLKSCGLVWSDMATIASLPHLQILKLQNNAVVLVGSEWNCFEQAFLCLKHLEINGGDLIHWSVYSSNFPVLETLSLKFLSKLEEIPSGIGDVLTLEKMNLFACSYSSAFSAVKIVEEQQSFGNLGLQLQIILEYKYEADRLLEEIEELDITRQNLFIYDRGRDMGMMEEVTEESGGMIKTVGSALHIKAARRHTLPTTDFREEPSAERNSCSFFISHICNSYFLNRFSVLLILEFQAELLAID